MAIRARLLDLGRRYYTPVIALQRALHDAICAIGIAVKRMTSLHGLALNACTVLDYDRLITPCGTPQFGITSISAQTGREVSWAEARDALLDSLEGAFGIEFEREEIPPGAPLPFPSNPVVETA